MSGRATYGRPLNPYQSTAFNDVARTRTSNSPSPGSGVSASRTTSAPQRVRTAAFTTAPYIVSLQRKVTRAQLLVKAYGRQMSSGLTGTRVSSRPVAARSAATTAAVETTVGGSPTPFTPYGASGSASSISTDSTGG